MFGSLCGQVYVHSISSKNKSESIFEIVCASKSSIVRPQEPNVSCFIRLSNQNKSSIVRPQEPNVSCFIRLSNQNKSSIVMDSSIAHALPS